jgi:hypothetical protein
MPLYSLDGVPEKKMRLVVKNFKAFKDSGDDVLSETFYAANIPWRIKTSRSDDKSSLACYISCLFNFEIPT